MSSTFLAAKLEELNRMFCENTNFYLPKLAALQNEMKISSEHMLRSQTDRPEIQHMFVISIHNTCCFS